jgi:hypothetical protein
MAKRAKKFNTSDGMEAVVVAMAKGKAVDLSPKLFDEAVLLMKMKGLLEIHETSTEAVKAFREDCKVSMVTAYYYYSEAQKLLQVTNPIKVKDININILVNLIVEQIHFEKCKTEPNSGHLDKLFGRYQSIIENHMGNDETLDWDLIKPMQHILKFDPSDFGYDENTKPNELKERALRSIKSIRDKEAKILDIEHETV